MTRPLASGDRRALATAAREWSATENPIALRTWAIVVLCADSGLRAGEVVKLDLCQVLERPTSLAIASSAYLRGDQAKGGDVGAGPFTISERARRALGAWLRAALERDWIALPAQPRAPLFVGHRLHRGAPGHGRLSKRASQWAWHELQRRAGLANRYGFHSLRHDAATRFRLAGGDVLDVAAHLRLRDIGTVARYCGQIDRAARAGELVEAAARL